MTLTVLLGGARSGKSQLAVRLASSSGAPVSFIATGRAGDREMAERIALHRAERPSGWQTLEEPLELAAAIESVQDGACVIVDCLSLWVSNLIELRPVAEIAAAAATAAAVAASRAGPTIAVTNEVGLGVVPATPLGRAYRDVLGRVNATWVAAARSSYFVLAGRALVLEPAEALHV